MPRTAATVALPVYRQDVTGAYGTTETIRLRPAKHRVIAYVEPKHGTTTDLIETSISDAVQIGTVMAPEGTTIGRLDGLDCLLIPGERCAILADEVIELARARRHGLRFRKGA